MPRCKKPDLYLTYQAEDRFTGELYEVTEKPVPPRKKYDYIKRYLTPYRYEIIETEPESEPAAI